MAEHLPSFWSIAVPAFSGQIDAALWSDGYLTIRPPPGAPVAFTLGVNGGSFSDTVTNGVGSLPIVYEIPLQKGVYVLNFTHTAPVLVSWRPVGS